MIEILILVVGFFVAWNVGANNTANCVGVSVGGRILSHRRAIAIVIVFVILGATLEGWKNMRTVGEGLISPGPNGENPLPAVPLATVASLIAAGLWMFLATVFGLPMSVSLSTVGAVIGAGFLINLVRPDFSTGLQYGKLGAILLSWILNPIISSAAAFIILRVVSSSIRRIKNVLVVNQVLTILILVASAYSAYAMGANDVGTSVGAVYGFLGGSAQVVALFGAAALAVGAITFSRRVMNTIGQGITRLEPITAFSAQMGAAITVWSFVQFGMPVSTSEAIVGGIAGAGLFKGASTVSARRLRQIGMTLALTPAVVALLSFGIGWLLLSL